jgi:hypothetical protein
LRGNGGELYSPPKPPPNASIPSAVVDPPFLTGKRGEFVPPVPIPTGKVPDVTEVTPVKSPPAPPPPDPPADCKLPPYPPPPTNK